MSKLSKRLLYQRDYIAQTTLPFMQRVELSFEHAAQFCIKSSKLMGSLAETFVIPELLVQLLMEAHFHLQTETDK